MYTIQVYRHIFDGNMVSTNPNGPKTMFSVILAPFIQIFTLSFSCLSVGINLVTQWLK